MNPPESEENMPSHYEKTQLAGRPLLIGLIGFFISMFVIYGVVWILLQHWSPEAWPRPHPPEAPTASGRWDSQSPELQVAPAPDLARLREAESQNLHARRWTDPAHTYATIPIEDAMKLLTDAAAKNQLATLLPAPQPATPLQLQNQKAGAAAPSRASTP